jgi:four helix bundle protein
LVSDGGISSYRDLKVWQDAVTLIEVCYLLTRKLPKDELFGLTSQIRRAATSVAANIAEGHGREHTRSFIQGLRIAQGSLKELETHLIVCQRVHLLDHSEVSAALTSASDIGKMLRALIRALQAREQGE